MEDLTPRNQQDASAGDSVTVEDSPREASARTAAAKERQGGDPDEQAAATSPAGAAGNADLSAREEDDEGESGPGLDLVMRIPVSVQAVLGETRLPISRLMKLRPGTVLPLNRQVGEPVDVMVNGRLVARGEVVLLDEDSNRFGISLTEIAEPGGKQCQDV